jgi:hypothetical protein
MFDHEAKSYDHRGWHAWEWLAVWGASLLAYAAGFVGFWQYTRAHGLDASLLECLYRPLQLFVLHMPHLDPPLNPYLEIARFASPLVAGYVALQVFLALFREHITLFRIRRSRDHVIVCGAGQKGLQLAKEHRANGERVVVVEADAASPGLRACEELRIPRLVADACDRRVLEAVRLERARKIVATCGNDGANLEIAILARQIASERRDPALPPLHCVVDVADMDLRTIFRQRKIVAGENRRIVVDMVGIDLYENSARLLLRRHPLHRVLIAPDSSLRVHLVVVGFGQMGESVVLQAARTSQYPNGRPLRVTVFDAEAPSKEALFRARYPEIERVCGIEFVRLDSGDPALLARASSYCAEKEFLVTFAICFARDELNLALALKLAPLLAACRSPIHVRMSSRSGLGLLLTEEQQHAMLGDQIRPFGMIEDACGLELLERTREDEMARAFHEDYVEKERLKSGTPGTNPSMVPWEDLDEQLKASNRHAADHVPVKLWAIGCRSSKTPLGTEPIAELTPPQVELLARIEHERYCAERFLAGWKPAPPGAMKDNAQKTNPTLVPWESLPEGEKEKDRAAIRCLPRVLGRVGEKIYP